ncbi:MAG: hypothetical protein QF685_01635 [Verrucomicrobiota bacterium]|jgi:hypothetical protein|nr:hypothetical protein [Verrucomicrobiota bacterium]
MKQITIVTKNRDGLTADIAAVLGDNNINIESLDAEEVEGMGVVTLMVDHYNRALHALRDSGWHAVTEDAFIIRVRDEPGALARVVKRFKDASIHVSSIRIIQHEGQWGMVAVSAEPVEEARALVKDKLLSD